jgi:6-phosphogluconolactonase
MRSNEPRTPWTRRQLLQGIGYTAALNSLPAMALSSVQSGGSAGRPKFAYVGSSEGNNGGSIHIFAVAGRRWIPIQRVPSASPSSLALHPNGAFLYVANETDTHKGLPCGAVEAYTIGVDDGRLTKLNQQPLSLSAIMPKSLAVSPDGQQVVVAVFGGGAYNTLPIAKDGSLLRVGGIIKEIGSGPHPAHQQAAHPHTVLFDSTGHRVLSTDAGSDRINVFGLSEGSFSPISRNAVQPGSAPGEMVIHPGGHLVFVANRLHASISSFRYSALNGSFEGRPHTALLSHDDSRKSFGAMAVHPSGQFLYTAAAAPLGSKSSSIVSIWKVDDLTGELSLMQSSQQSFLSPRKMVLSAEGDALYLLDGAGHGAYGISVDQKGARLGRSMPVANVANASSLAIKYS